MSGKPWSYSSRSLRGSVTSLPHPGSRERWKQELVRFLLLSMAPAHGMMLTCSPHQLIRSRDPTQSHPKFTVQSDSESHQIDKIEHHSKAEGRNSFLFNRSSTKLIIFIRPLPGPSTPNMNSSKRDCFQMMTVYDRDTVWRFICILIKLSWRSES